MQSRRSDLPDFSDPPVEEVLLSLQFAAITDLKTAHVGVYWEGIRKRYPFTSEQPEVNPVFETFGTIPQTQPNISLQTFMAPPMPRFWFENAPGGPELLQIQRDRLMRNWRKGDGKAPYPRYEAIRRSLQQEAQEYSAFLKKENLGELLVNQCEVTYINIVEDLPGKSDLHGALNSISPLWSGLTTDDPPGEVENSLVQIRYILSRNGERVGRIHVSMQPAFRPADFKPVFRIEITARGRPTGSTLKDAFEMLDFEREAVVKTFASVTSTEMHKLWKRNDA